MQLIYLDLELTAGTVLSIFQDKETRLKVEQAAEASEALELSRVSFEYGLSFVTVLFDLGIGTFDL